jgi:hypothetical protein
MTEVCTNEARSPRPSKKARGRNNIPCKCECKCEYSLRIAESLPTSTAEHSSAADSADQQQSDPQIQQSAQQWPAVLELHSYNVAHSAVIPAYHFWNTEFTNKQPAFIRLNLTLPWNANFAVYGRRNVAPSVTQYDFVEFVKAGRLDHRLKREAALATDGAVSFALDSSRRASTAGPSLLAASHELDEEMELAEDEPEGPRRSSSSGLHPLAKRSSLDVPPGVNVSLLQYLDTGRWFLSVYNDELQPHKVTLVVTEAEGVSTTCPNDCSGRGSCYLGKCDCIDRYQVRILESLSLSLSLSHTHSHRRIPPIRPYRSTMIP